MPEQGIKEGYLAVPGGRVWYGISGADQGGIPLLLLHGGPGATHDYLEPLEALASERPVVFYDQLGGGLSERPEDSSLWTMERFVEELAAVRYTLGLERVHLLGQSWGAMLAVDYLLSRRPAGVMSLIFSGPCLSASRFAADQQAYLRQFPEETQKIIREVEAAGDFQAPAYQEAMLAYYRRHLCRLDPWPECLNRTFERMGLPVYQQMWGPSEFTITGMLKDYERAGQLKEIRLPALFTCGRFDEATPETTAYYRSCLPGAELAVFEDASHTHHLEKTDEYLAVVGDFLNRAEKS